MLSYLISSTIREVEGEIRFTVKILDMKQERYAWIRHYDRTLSRSFRMLEYIAQDLTAALHKELNSSGFNSDPELAVRNSTLLTIGASTDATRP